MNNTTCNYFLSISVKNINTKHIAIAIDKLLTNSLANTIQSSEVQYKNLTKRVKLTANIFRYKKLSLISADKRN